MIKKIFVVIFFITSAALVAQRTNSSPYSFYGIGERYSPRTVEQNSMGGIGVAYNHYKYLNFTNPAANAFLRRTTYSLAVTNTNLNIQTTDKQQTSIGTNLNYLALGFPIGEKAGFSFGLQPISSIGYSLVNNTFINGELDSFTIFNGEGGVNRIFGGFGIKLTKELALGLEVDFSFGNSESSITNQRDNVALATRYREIYNTRGNSLTLGAQYQKKLKDNLHVDAGVTSKLGNDLNVTGNEFLYSFTLGATGVEVSRDTLTNVALNGRYKLPVKSIIGVGVGKYDKWYLGLEYENQNAIQTEGLSNNTNTAFRYENANRFSLGGFYLPKINSVSNYFQRITYRAGLRYESLGLAVNGTGPGGNFTSINDFGMSFGLGIPLKGLSALNLAAEYGQRGTTNNNLVQENYFNFRLSLSLSDRWFIKRKID